MLNLIQISKLIEFHNFLTTNISTKQDKLKLYMS